MSETISLEKVLWAYVSGDSKGKLGKVLALGPDQSDISVKERVAEQINVSSQQAERGQE